MENQYENKVDIYSIEKKMENPVDMMKAYGEMMAKMQAQMAAMTAKDEARDKEIKELKKKGEVSEKKLKALEKDNRKLKKEGEFNKKSLGVLRNDNRKLKRNIAAMRVGEEGIEVIGGTATPTLHKTINYEKTGESDEGTIEKFTLGISRPDFGGQLDVSRKIVGDLLKSVLDRPVKFVETLVLKMVKGLLSKNTDVDLPMESETITVMNASEVEDAVRLSAERIIAKIESYQDRGSNWRVILVEKHEVDVVHFNPLVGSSFIELPAPLKSNMNGLINIENVDDDECFRWCHVRHLRPGQRATKITRSDRKFAKTLNYNGIKFPVRINDIPKIEKANELRITVIMLRGERMFFPRYTSKFDYKDHMELLLMDDGEGNNHYVLVRDISMLLNSLSKTQHKRFFCLGCLNGFNSQERLDKHSGTCREVNGTQKSMMPKRGSKVVFKNHRRQLPVQFVIYADFESLLIPVDGKGECLRKTHDHEMCSYGFKRVCYYDGKYDGEYKSYRGVGAISRSLSELLGEVEKCNGIIQSEFNKEVVMSVKDYDKLEKATECHICGGKFGESDKKVLDHCHVTSKFRGAAHNSCNLNHKLTGKIPVVFHNLRGYDGNFIMQGVKELVDGRAKRRLSRSSPYRSKVQAAVYKEVQGPSCYVGKGPEFQKVVFDLHGQSPLVKHFLQNKRLAKDSGTSILVQRTEIDKLPPINAPTYRDVIKESLKSSHELEKQIQSLLDQMSNERTIFGRQQKKEREEFRKKETQVLSRHKEVKKISDLILLRLAKGKSGENDRMIATSIANALKLDEEA
ncbi:Hypothetical predicted protein [Paramuricea clavata]|uniref:Uncharacterized protein n=1 Tax=Paramuricea clavata TaxID=317549 RepID=A0A6S7FWM7_PARCT|nr:Hypothetical predicted protein [Paramuricea clavata]